MSAREFVAARKEIEDLVGLEEFYRIEEATVRNADAKPDGVPRHGESKSGR